MRMLKYLFLIIAFLACLSVYATGTPADSISKHRVELAVITSFTASYNTDKTVVNLHWVTSGKVSRESYLIERSIDSVHYELIGETTSLSASNAAQHYYFDDPHPMSGKTFYRLHLIDSSKKSFYSAAVSVVKKISALELDNADIGPNEMEIGIGIVSPGNVAANILVSDLNGDVLKTENFALKQGANYRKIYIGELKKGIYFLQVNDKTDQVSRMQKFLKH